MKQIKANLDKSGEDRILKVTGSVRTPLDLGMEDLRALMIKEMVDISIQCGTGGPQGHIRISRGVFVKNVIRMDEAVTEEDNDTKNMFVIASADDGRKAVFSWQEICNTSVGNGVMILLEEDNNTLENAQGLLHLISAQDYFADSRHVQGLRNIEVVLTR